MRSLKDIWNFARSPKAVTPPAPDELARTFAHALIASGMDPAAAISQAWWAVPHFYQGRAKYVTVVAPTFYGMSPEREPDPRHGETGDIGGMQAFHA
jgi:hypothetical protein